MQNAASDQNSVAFITGGASGIGEATARHFAQMGWIVVIADVDEARAKALVAELVAESLSCAFTKLDVTDEKAVEAAVDLMKRDYGHVDVLVNSGGLLQNAIRITSLDVADFDRILDVNLRGAFVAGKEFGKVMIERGSGSIINIGSLTTYQPWPQPAYAVSKAGLKMLTEVMAAEFGPSGVRVNAVAPGYTLTPAMRSRINRGERDPSLVIARSALKRFVEPREVAQAIYFLCSDAASAITGVTMPIDCGWLVYSAYSSAAAQPM